MTRLLLALLGLTLRTILRRHQPDRLPDPLIDASELCLYGLEVSRRRQDLQSRPCDPSTRH